MELELIKTNEPILKIENLCKKYGKHLVLEDISFDVSKDDYSPFAHRHR
jgi:ABC-type phosphonate transport system ATPase subunit